MLNKFIDWLQKYLNPFADKLNSNIYLSAVRDGFFGATSILIIGSIFLLFANLPIPGYTEFMTRLFGSGWSTFFSVPYDMTMNIMVIYVVVGMAKSMARSLDVDDIQSIILSFVAIFILNPVILDKSKAEGIPVAAIGPSGIFLSIVATLLTVKLFSIFIKKGWRIQMPSSVPDMVSNSFTALLPGAVIMIIAVSIRMLFALTQFGTFQGFVLKLIQTPLLKIGSSYGATIVVEFLEALIFTFGLHGPSIINSVMQPIWLTLTAQNQAAFQAGKSLPHIMNLQFDANYIKLGGTGTTIGLAILCTYFAHSKQLRTLGKLAFAPSIFNINEPLIFGLPIVLNPILMIPFALSPIVFASLSWAVTAVGWVPIANGTNIPFTTPPIIAGFLISGWQGAVWNIVEIFLSIAWYYPFFRIFDRDTQKLDTD
ncbi:PTS sugar transporter subunit IIC [Schleiferilactobacillus perolens]|uniref:Permease IIC component n=1 Tax=Schleiferilactobacillus perolens DSM 12744 TaxID=1423792 RepID=A0A0R1N2V8_9LACO|nr:PTS transporter subunit EIIC [Schleiferilactobacillus perolens]KRL14541.1 phosphotransferase system enzyme IIC permease component [Schleiferilactobacillus perolens DSM 12744]